MRKFPDPPKMISTLIPEVGTHKQNGAAESAGPRLVIDVAVPGRQETGALGAGELTLSGTNAHAAVHPVHVSKLQGRAGPIFEDVLASVEEVRFALPQEGFPVSFVENGDAPSRPRTDRWLEILSTSKRSTGTETSSAVT